MADEARKYRYADAVTGSVAYDYRSTAAPVPREFPEPEREAERRRNRPDELERERARERVRERDRARERERQREEAQKEVQTGFGLPVLAVIGVVAVAVLMVMVLMSYVELTKLSAEQARLEKDLQELEAAGDKLMIAYESTFNMSELERYAVNVLGMTKLTDKDTTVLRVNKEDRAEILHEDDADEGFFAKLAAWVDKISEYFR